LVALSCVAIITSSQIILPNGSLARTPDWLASRRDEPGDEQPEDCGDDLRL
jgi:hypothetical protein